jgi:hypothetical protein
MTSGRQAQTGLPKSDDATRIAATEQSSTLCQGAANPNWLKAVLVESERGDDYIIFGVMLTSLSTNLDHKKALALSPEQWSINRMGGNDSRQSEYSKSTLESKARASSPLKVRNFATIRRVRGAWCAFGTLDIGRETVRA